MSFRPLYALGCPVSDRQFPLFVHRHPREAVVGRVAENHENGRFLFHPLRAVALFLQFWKGERLVRFGLPAGERVGEKDARALVIGQRRAESVQGEADL